MIDHLRLINEKWLRENDLDGFNDIVDIILTRYGADILQGAVSQQEPDWQLVEHKLKIEYDPDFWVNDFIDDGRNIAIKHFANEIACELSGIYQKYDVYCPEILVKPKRQESCFVFYTTLFIRSNMTDNAALEAAAAAQPTRRSTRKELINDRI